MRFALTASLCCLAGLGPLAALRDCVEVDFVTLSGFDWQEGVELPAAVRKLDRQKIAITGFMRVETEDEDITSFWLVDQNCNCQGVPKMNERIFCTLPDGQHVQIDDRPVTVEGVLSASEDREGDYILSLYRIEVEKLR